MLIKSKQLRIAILGLFGSSNHGNEATLAAFVHHVSRRLPGTEFVCIAPPQSNIEATLGFPHILLDPLPVARYFWRIRPHSLRSACSRLAQRASEVVRRRTAIEMLDGISVLVMPGTGIIDDFGQGPLDLPTHLDRWTFAAAQLGIPSSFLSIGVSTVSRAESRMLFRRSLLRAAYCSFRDTTSSVNAKALGYQGVASVFPDLAFSLPPEWLAPASLERPRRVIGIGVMGYFGWNRSESEGQRIYRRYLDKLCQVVAAVRADGDDIRLLTGDARADDATARHVMDRCGGEGPSLGRLIAEPILNFRDVLSQIGLCDLVVATRFHNVLFSLLLKRPTISIGYGDKNDALMADFGLQRYCHRIESFEVEAVLQHIRHLERYPRDALDAVPVRLDEARTKLDAQYDHWCARWATR
jgi:polysaccharide pyruvyl transferase WcaK-like protein